MNEQRYLVSISLSGSNGVENIAQRPSFVFGKAITSRTDTCGLPSAPKQAMYRSRPSANPPCVGAPSERAVKNGSYKCYFNNVSFFKKKILPKFLLEI